MSRKTVHTDRAPKAIGPYSQAILQEGPGGRTLYCAGQIALDPATMEIVPGDIRDHTDRVMRNIEGVLEAVIARVPPPRDQSVGTLQALIFDSVFDQFRGVIVYVRVIRGKLRAGDAICGSVARSPARTSTSAWLASSCDWPIAISLIRKAAPCDEMQSRIFGNIRLSMIWPWISTSSKKPSAVLLPPRSTHWEPSQ